VKLLKVAASVLLAASVSLYAQEREKQAPPPKQEAKPAQPQQRAPEQRQAQPQQQRPQQAQPQQQQRAQQPQQQQRTQQAQPQQQQQRAQQPQQQQRTQQAQPQQQQQRAQQPAPARQSQPAQRASNVQPAQQARSSGQSGGSYAPPQRSTQQAQAWQQKSGWRQQGAWQGQATFQAGRSSNWAGEHRTWGQRGGYGGYFIPQASFGLYFGEGHYFRIGSQPFLVGGYPEFRYGGYTFMMVDPWPGDWAADWYDRDQMYVGYDDGYYLYDQMHPGEAVALTVVM
jgi:hypothetical protein